MWQVIQVCIDSAFGELRSNEAHVKVLFVGNEIECENIVDAMKFAEVTGIAMLPVEVGGEDTTEV